MKLPLKDLSFYLNDPEFWLGQAVFYYDVNEFGFKFWGYNISSLDIHAKYDPLLKEVVSKKIIIVSGDSIKSYSSSDARTVFNIYGKELKTWIFNRNLCSLEILVNKIKTAKINDNLHIEDFINHRDFLKVWFYENKYDTKIKVFTMEDLNNRKKLNIVLEPDPLPNNQIARIDEETKEAEKSVPIKNHNGIKRKGKGGRPKGKSQIIIDRNVYIRKTEKIWRKNGLKGNPLYTQIQSEIKKSKYNLALSTIRDICQFRNE